MFEGLAAFWVVIMILVLFWAVMWICVPFDIHKMRSVLIELLAEQKLTNDLLKRTPSAEGLRK